MRREIFIDTGAWFAAFVPSDPDHVLAKSWIEQNSDPLITTDYVLDELLTLLRIRGEHTRALQLGEKILSNIICSFIPISDSDIQSAWEVYKKFNDKNWSFTDCASKVFMERQEIKKAFAFDLHFKQFGTVTVVP